MKSNQDGEMLGELSPYERDIAAQPEALRGFIDSVQTDPVPHIVVAD